MAKIFAFFPGQGSQKVGMGADLLDLSPLSNEYFQRAEAKLGFSLLDICQNGPTEKLTLTEIAQPAILTVSSIFFELTRHRFDIAVAAGHSLGEYSALVASGSLTFDDAVLLVHKRGKYMQEAVPVGQGKMAAVLGQEVAVIEEALAKVTQGEAEIANINSPGQVVVSGSAKGIDEFISILSGTKIIELPVSAPFHSRLMEDAEKKLALELEKVEIRPPAFPVMSNYFAEPLTNPDQIRDALRLQVCGKVRWVECVQNGIAIFKPESAIEFGTGNTLTGLLKRIDSSLKSENINSKEKIS